MKKNIFSVIITVLVCINVVLTAIMFFIMVPTFNKTNSLITQVASVLNLELDADKDAKGDGDYTVADLEYTTATFDADQTVNLKKSDADSSLHYAIFKGYTLGVNKKADDYKNFGTETVASYQSTITDIIRSVIQSYSNDNIEEEAVKKEALAKIQEQFDTKCIVSLTLANFTHQ